MYKYICFFTETEAEIKKKVIQGRKKYKSTKYFQTDSSFEESNIAISQMVSII